MKILLIHADFIEYEAKTKALKDAEEVKERGKKVEECLVVFTSIESGDNKISVRKAVDEVKRVTDDIKVQRIVIYPWVHLTSRPAPAKEAQALLQNFAEALKGAGFSVERAPFGWYKSFSLKCKGHPLAELSREITPVEETREEIVEKIKSEYFVLTPDGKEEKIDLDKLDESKLLKNYNNLKKFILSEELGEKPKKEPPSLRAMQRLELVGYAPESDPGNFKFYPKGFLIYDLLRKWAAEITTKRLRAMQIETPLIYDWSDPEIREQGKSFHERHYIVSIPGKQKELVLRFAGDFGLFKMLKNATISYYQLPLRFYEFSLSFRCEKRGELIGLKRLRAFSMPDLHSFCTDEMQAWKEYEELFKKYTDYANALNVDYVVAFRVVKDYYEKYKDKIISLLKYCGKPAFIEVLSEMKHYWAIKHEFQFIDSVGSNCQLSTVQLDVKDAENYGITYVDKDGKEKGCIICHSSVGSIERWMYALLEQALKSKRPVLPLWLSPIQVRLVPMNNSLLSFAEEIANKLESESIRVDIDDRSLTLNKKIREAEMEWVPMIVVIGEKERSSGEFSIRFKENGKVEKMKLDELIKYVKERTKEYPYRYLNLPRLLSKRPKFVGGL